IATNGASATRPVRAIHGCRYSSPTRLRPGSPRSRRASRSFAVLVNGSASAAATISVSPPVSSATYSSPGCTATARLAGSVQGVVVQTTSDGVGAEASSGGGATSGNLTYTDGVRCSSYSTSAWARAVLQHMHPWTGLSPL